MSFSRRLMLSASVLLAALTSNVLAESGSAANELFAQGQKFLAGGDFEAAVKAFASAAKKDSDNQVYRDQYALVRRIAKMRETIGKEKNSKKWQETAAALRSFYYENSLYSEALPLDEQFYEKEKSPASAALLARTQLELGRSADAAKTLHSVRESDRTPEVLALLGIAEARQGDVDAAKKLATQAGTPEQTDAGLHYDLARLNALTGRTPEAAAALTRCFELTPPSRLDGMKKLAATCKDLEPVVTAAAYADVFKTASKVKESSCSSGSSCGSCPSKSSCSSKSGSSTPCPSGEKK